MIMGVVCSLLPILLKDIRELSVLVFSSSSLGFAFGIGMPSCLAFFSESVRIENRGSASGVVFLSSNIAIVFLSIFLREAELSTVALTAGLWRALGLVLLIFFKPKEEAEAKGEKHPSFGSVFKNKQFLLYFVPWLAFCLIDWFEKPIRETVFGELASSLNIAGLAITSFCSIVGGLLCDKIGRKPTVIYGFISIGIAYAILSIAPNNSVIWYFYVMIESIAWGFFYPIFIMVLWGDLSRSHESEKYYAIGSTPIFVIGVIEILAKSYVLLIPPEAAFSLAAFFLFLAVLPLVFAPETLPEKKIREREVRQYIEKAKKIREKFT
jgi:MFS family permease